MENQDGKRVARGPGMPRGGKIALAVVLVLVLALAGGYVGLCAYAGSSAFLPNTSIAGVDVSGQSREGLPPHPGGRPARPAGGQPGRIHLCGPKLCGER